MTKGDKNAIIIAAVAFIISMTAFLYTFFQTRYVATIVEVERARTVTNAGMARHGRRTHRVIPLVVKYTDRNGTEQTVRVSYPWPKYQPKAGQEIKIVRGAGKFVTYPWSGLRWFSGFLALGMGLFLFFMCMDKRSLSGGVHE